MQHLRLLYYIALYYMIFHMYFSGITWPWGNRHKMWDNFAILSTQRLVIFHILWLSGFFNSIQ